MPETCNLAKRAKTAALKLLDYCEANDWKGYDPYDALNSRLLKYLPFLDFRLFRIGLTQLLKRNPVNLRPLLLIPKTENPKAIALFLMALIKLSKIGLLDREELIGMMAEKLLVLRSPGTSYWCWGYSFPWQTRTIIVPFGAPNLVCTTFVANALLDAYEKSGESRYLNAAISGAKYIINELYWTDGNSTACFSYPLPSVRARVHNANFLAAAILARIYKVTGDDKFVEPAMRAARYSAGRQHEDGSWDYGEAQTQKWADNFHTGYNLCALRSLSECVGITEFNPQIARGFQFYRAHFFREDGAPKYFHNRTYPIDVHSVAQSIITLLTFKDLDEKNVALANAVLKWAMANMWDGKGYFYYQALPFSTFKLSYMRWSQAWMLLALSTLLEIVDQTAVSGKLIRKSGKVAAK